MATPSSEAPAAFDPSSFQTFRFVSASVDASGLVSLRYALDDEVHFVEELQLPVEGEVDPERFADLLPLLHWVAGVSYYKTALPARVSFDKGPLPSPAVAALLEALYSEGLGELAYRSGLGELPRPRFAAGPAAAIEPAAQRLRRVLVPVGGGKDSAVALEIVRSSGLETALFSLGDAAPITRTVAVAGLPRLLARRRLDPGLFALNEAGAHNGHVPITAIVTCAALLTAALNGFDAVAMANERSASQGNVVWDGVEVNHQFSKSLRAERLLSAALAEIGSPVRQFSVLRGASELGIARAFARMDAYHRAFTSCNAIFRLDPQLRAASWCGDCPKCRFVFLVLAPFCEPAHLAGIFGADLLDDERQLEGFALLTATGGHKPFECVGEEQESIAAIRLLADDPRWRDRRVVRALVERVLPEHDGEGDPRQVLALSDEHDVPDELMTQVRAFLGS